MYSSIFVIAATGVLAQSIAIRGITIVDVAHRQLSPARNVTILKDRIWPFEIPNPGLVINGNGKYMIPGLWDMHALSLADPAAYVARGVTGVRDMSSAPLDETLELYRAIEAGKRTGPRILTGGPGIRASDPAQARVAFDRLFDTQADFIRFDQDLDYETFIALAERTRKWRYPLVGPLPRDVRLRDAISLRQSSIEGLDGIDRLSHDQACGSFQAAAVARVWFTPGLSVLPQRARKKGEAILTLMRECGAPVLAGPGVVEDLIAMVESAGFSTYDALRTATVEPARYLGGEEEFGSVEPGKLADLVILDANPVEDINNITRVSAVILRGRYLGSKTLETLRRPPAAK